MPSLITAVPAIFPTTHGIRYSRLTIAQWLNTPPVSATTSVTAALALIAFRNAHNPRPA